MDAVGNRKLLSPSKIEPRPSNTQPVAIPTELSRLLVYIGTGLNFYSFKLLPLSFTADNTKLQSEIFFLFTGL